MDRGALSAWWYALAAPPQPLRRIERAAFWLAAILIGATRFAAISRTLWDWDEALFVLAVGDFDVTAHHPHPPGFPLFVAAARLLPFEPFASLRALVVLSSLFVFPAAFAFARELRLPNTTAFSSALLLAFAPNVWLFGGTAFSDVPAMVLALGSGAMLLRGCRGKGALLAGAILLGAGAAIRPQNLLLGAVPLLIVFTHSRAKAIGAAVIAAAIVAVSFGAAASASGGWDAYREALREHQAFIRAHDSFLSPVRPSLLRVADDFFLRPYRAPLINVAMAVLAAAALLRIRRRPDVWAALATFGPFSVLAWLFLDFHSASRFSLAYAPLVSILAAEGLPRRGRAAGAALLALAMSAWIWPALRIVRETDSPPVMAAKAVRRLAPGTTLVHVDSRMAAHAAVLLPDYTRVAAEARPPAVMHERARVVLLREGSSAAAGALNFGRTRGHLAGIVRPRYFEASIVPARRIAFGDGWYQEEGELLTPFRWMSARSVTHLPAFPGPSTLSLRFSVPVATTVTIRADGSLLERFAAPAGAFERAWRIDGARELVIETGSTIHAAGDPRPLGLRLDAMELR